MTRDEVVDAVLEGVMTVEEAEEWGAQQGSPFTVVPENATNTFDSPFWTMEQAVAWIAWRDLDHAAWAVALFEQWGGCCIRSTQVEGQFLDIAAATKSLWNTLLAGKIMASGRKRGDGQRRTDGTPRVEVPNFELIDLEWECGVGIIRPFQYNSPQWTDVYVPSDKAKAEWPTHDVPPILEILKSAQKRPSQSYKGGHPGKWDWDAMWVETVRLAIADKITDRPALTAMIQAWFQNNYNDEPSESMLKSKMSKLFKVLDQD